MDGQRQHPPILRPPASSAYRTKIRSLLIKSLLLMAKSCSSSFAWPLPPPYPPGKTNPVNVRLDDPRRPGTGCVERLLRRRRICLGRRPALPACNWNREPACSPASHSKSKNVSTFISPVASSASPSPPSASVPSSSRRSRGSSNRSSGSSTSPITTSPASPSSSAWESAPASTSSSASRSQRTGPFASPTKPSPSSRRRWSSSPTSSIR